MCLCYILFCKNRRVSHAHKNENSLKKILIQITPRSKEETLLVSKDTRANSLPYNDEPAIGLIRRLQLFTKLRCHQMT